MTTPSASLLPVIITTPTEVPRVCYQGEYQCSDSSCVKAYLVCDGVCQCGDCSDEEYCGKTTKSVMLERTLLRM